MSRNSCCGISQRVVRIIRGLSVFCKAFTKCAFCFPNILLIASFAFNRVCKVRRLTSYVLFNLSEISCSCKGVSCTAIVYMGTSKAAMFRVAAKGTRG